MKYLFDIDGTLTPSRKKIEHEFLEIQQSEQDAVNRVKNLFITILITVVLFMGVLIFLRKRILQKCPKSALQEHFRIIN